MSKTKSVFIIPPKWYCLNPPSFMVPTVSYLRNLGYETKMLDLNIDFYDTVLDKKYLLNSISNAEKQMPELFEYLKNNFSKEKNQGDYDNDFKLKLLRYNKIKEFTQEKKEKVKNAINTIEHSMKVMKDKELFYNPAEFTTAFANLDFCLEIASLPYFPSKIQIRTYNDPFFKLEYKDMLKNAKEKNMFTDFYINNMSKITKSNPDVIGIAIDATTQIVSALTLCFMLKQQTNAKILICGNFFTRLTDVIKKYPEFFNNFCDYIIPDEVEMPTLPKLFDYFEGKTELKDVPNILYVENGEVKENEFVKPIHLNEHPAWDISDFEFQKYPTPSIVMPVLSSRGCYWGKCSFCDHSFGQKMDIKPVKQFVDELEELNKKHGIKHFELIDECISPKYIYEMSKEIIKRKLEIYWFNYARLETDFTQEILSTAYKAGCRMLLWGVESGSIKVMEDINKGIDLDKRDEILRTARNAGIWNFAFIFFGFPTETAEDANMTIDYIKNNTDIISSYGKSMFTFGKHTTLNEQPEKFGITKIYKEKEEFSPRLHFETSKGMTKKELDDVSFKCLIECRNAYKNPLWMYLIYREILFLYICKLGIDKVESMSVENMGNFTDEECANGTVDIWRQSKSL